MSCAASFKVKSQVPVVLHLVRRSSVQVAVHQVVVHGDRPFHFRRPVVGRFFSLYSRQHGPQGLDGGVERSLRVQGAGVLESVVDALSFEIVVEGPLELPPLIGRKHGGLRLAFLHDALEGLLARRGQFVSDRSCHEHPGKHVLDHQNVLEGRFARRRIAFARLPGVIDQVCHPGVVDVWGGDFALARGELVKDLPHILR